jgi:hypothetical protein
LIDAEQIAQRVIGIERAEGLIIDDRSIIAAGECADGGRSRKRRLPEMRRVIGAGSGESVSPPGPVVDFAVIVTVAPEAEALAQGPAVINEARRVAMEEAVSLPPYVVW